MGAALSKSIPPIVVRMAVAIIFGAATTIGVSWILALNVRSGGVKRWMWGREYDVALQVIRTSPERDAFFFVQVTRSRCWGTDIVEVGEVWAPENRQYGSTHALVEGTAFAAEMREVFDRGEAPPEVWWRADGWPRPALSADARWTSNRDRLSAVNGGYLIDPITMTTDFRVLPLRPIWTGFVVDTLLYGSVLFVVPTIRFWRRHWRRQCVRCGYKLQSEQDRCSECGKQVARTRQCRAG